MKMKVHVGRLVTVMLIAGLFGGPGASPASAGHDTTVCVVPVTNFGLNAGLWLFGLGPAVTAAVTPTTNVGRCVNSGGLTSAAVTEGAVVSHTVHVKVHATPTPSPTPTAWTHDTDLPTDANPSVSNAGGWCGHSHGRVTVVVNNDGGSNVHVGNWVSAGTMLVFVGPHVFGVVNALVNVTVSSNSCLNGTAHVFLVSGVVVLP